MHERKRVALKLIKRNKPEVYQDFRVLKQTIRLQNSLIYNEVGKGKEIFKYFHDISS